MGKCTALNTKRRITQYDTCKTKKKEKSKSKADAVFVKMYKRERAKGKGMEHVAALDSLCGFTAGAHGIQSNEQNKTKLTQCRVKP